MPGVRWSVKLDIALCLAVFNTRPQKTADWEKVATSLGAEQAETAEQALPKARGCKDRMLLLIKKYKEEDKRSLKGMLFHLKL